MGSSTIRFSFWTRHSSILLGGFLFTIFLIIYIWWPLAEEYLAYVPWGGPWWLYIDWLLIGIFLFMSLTVVAGADMRRDSLIIVIGTFGGLVIESWGTQTNLWHYYTAERPPLWIIPAWPIASLSISRMTQFLDHGIQQLNPPDAGLTRSSASDSPAMIRSLYWLIFSTFLILMVLFVWPTFNKLSTILSLLLCILLIFTPVDQRTAVLTFICGSLLGIFLERWGTTRECWTYYTLQTPPLFAILAHGMASVAFWRTGLILKTISLLLFKTEPPHPHLQ